MVTIDDSTAITETAEAVTEDLEKADAAFDREDNERARPLYYSSLQSHAISDADHSRVSHRMALIALAAGEPDEAYRHALHSKEPGPGRRGARVPAGGRDRQGRRTHRRGPHMGRLGAGECVRRRRQEARARRAAGGRRADPDENPYETDGSRRLMAGLAAWEAGDQATSKTEFEAVLAATNVTDVDKGRAAFYLGSMAYHRRDHDTARTHLHTARDSAVDPEQSWAKEMLEWRWQEEGS